MLFHAENTYILSRYSPYVGITLPKCLSTNCTVHTYFNLIFFFKTNQYAVHPSPSCPEKHLLRNGNRGDFFLRALWGVAKTGIIYMFEEKTGPQEFCPPFCTSFKRCQVPASIVPPALSFFSGIFR